MFQEALLGAVLGALIQEIVQAKEKATFFKKTLQHLESTLESIFPIICEILKKENAPTDACSKFVEQLKKAKVLVEMYSDIKKWKLLKKRKVKKLIQEMDASLQRFLTRDFQAQQLLYLAIIVDDIGESNRKMDRIISLLERNSSADATFGIESDSKPENEETPSGSSPESSTNTKNKTSKPAFELHWQMSKDKCLDIRFWRHNHD
ncbi:uncharacterized protein LOC126657452 [Mercurialis annua]|uniref:uncharacterized protein LOC126657452 n=1 Tax=Mercurialis annua TaxID=3986 RepID=UPI002160171B|nr:uncharacterized protein LOC126657452 [Mercurialis annua]